MAVTVQRLKCEYEVNPIGIGARRPRLSWTIDSDRRGEKQTAYQIVVAKSPDALQSDRGDLWDSGKIASEQSVHIEYGGGEMTSGLRCHWKVRVWDKDGKPSAYSEPALWEMGLLRPQDWAAKWIEAPKTTRALGGFANAFWIWFPEGNPAASAPGGERYFRREFEIPAGKQISSAAVSITVDDHFVLLVNGKEVLRSLEVAEDWKNPKHVDVRPHLRAGKNALALIASNEPGTMAGILCKLIVELAGDQPLMVHSDNQWKCSQEKKASWETVGFDDSSWQAAQQVAAFGLGPWIGRINIPRPASPPPHLRKEITIAQGVRKARLYVTALGWYEFRINGQRVGDQIFAPDWTDYKKRVQYQAYDVTGLLLAGDNTLSAILGEGWYCGYVGMTGPNNYGLRPALLAQLVVELADGRTQTFISDSSWKYAEGPILSSDALMGEVYDARREMSGWDRSGFDDSKWLTAATRHEELVPEAKVGPPVRRMLELKPKSLTEPSKGAFVFDMGQNMVGWVRLKVKASAGTQITLRFAEMLNPDGTMYTTNLRGAKCIDTYTCKGGGEETWEPTFTFHGFRYVEITGLDRRPALDAITGIVVHSDTPRTGTWECSDPALNQLQSNIQWGQRGNFLSVPTDCPQRDERLGWMGDAQVFIKTASFNMDVCAFFEKWLIDVDDAQDVEGAFSDVAPKVCCGQGAAAWADAGVICPWTTYVSYADKKILADHYDAMTRWIAWQVNHTEELIRPAGWYGDWLSIGADTPTDLLGTAYFAYSTDLVSRAAAVLGKEADAQKYRKLFEDIKYAFNRKFVTPDGRIHGNTQSCYLVALKFNLLAESLRPIAAQHLVDDIKSKDWHLSTGFVGVSYLLPVLTACGFADVAYRLLKQDTFPSWLFSVKHGATTIWERWDGWTPEKGFQDPLMNSFNHYSLGSCGEWMYDTITGIGVDQRNPGFKHILLRPRPGGGLSWAKASYDSAHGTIRSEWKLSGKRFDLNVKIPANTTATLTLPSAEQPRPTESGQPIDSAEGVRVVERETDGVVLELASGSYQFSSMLAVT